MGGREPGPAPLGCPKLKRGRGRAGEAEEAGLHRNPSLFPARLCEVRGCLGGQSPPARLFPAASAARRVLYIIIMAAAEAPDG